MSQLGTKAWRLEDIPGQTGRLAVITGATGGLGYETALGLAAAGATVVLTGRHAGKGAADGALPTLFAATAPEAKGGGYYGPQGFYELKGPVHEAFIASKAYDAAVAAQLWSESEQLTGVRWSPEPKKDTR